MRIMIFTEGTILMHKNALGFERGDIVKQVINKDMSVKKYGEYVPIRNAPSKIQMWASQGAKIIYITSRKNPKEINEIQNVLDRNNFPTGQLEYRKDGESYIDVIERITPDILIEDDCESIGGKKEMIYQHIIPEVKESIKFVVIREFEGIDNLPNDVAGFDT